MLGIDTSNYTTSVAVVRRDGEIVFDLRKLLEVERGKRGLRQSTAFFQHVETLPLLLGKALDEVNERIAAVSVSERPRPLETSYMPVFRAGVSFAETLSHALCVPLFKFSHQEGHIEVIKGSGRFKDKTEMLCFHLSGGTCELLRISGDSIDIIGGSRDISFGQVIDRVGVGLGMDFPCGGQFDCIALKTDAMSSLLKDIPVNGTEINLSGIETQAGRAIGPELSIAHRDMLIKELLNKICNAIIKMSENAVKSTGIRDILLTGGVASSRFIAGKLTTFFDKSTVNVEFGDQRLATDNAVGVACLGGKRIWL